MLRFSSLSARLVFAVLATAALMFSALVGLTFLRLDHGLARQAEELGRLSEEKLSQKLDGEARLAGARLEMLFARFTRSVESIAQRADIAKAIAGRNVVEIAEMLDRARRVSDIDGIIVVDEKMRVVGADGDDLDIVATNRALHQHAIGKDIIDLLADNDRKAPRVIRRSLDIDQNLAAAIRAKGAAALGFLAVQPLFDEFGDVAAALVAHRMLRPSESVIEEFSKLDGAGIVVLSGDRPISWAGIGDNPLLLELIQDSTLLRTNSGDRRARCIPALQRWSVCALTRVAELYALRDELVRIGEREGRSLARWLVFATLISLFVFAFVTLFASRQVARPLARITHAVRAVARGDWKSEVVGAERKDEVGDIARAVMVLQRSLQERDRLRSDVAQAEAIKKRREMLEDAIRRFDRMMRSMLLSVSDTVETMDDTVRDLARMSVVAEGEAAEAAFVSEHTIANVSELRIATEKLNRSISEIASHVKQNAGLLAQSSTAAISASDCASGLAQASADLDEIVARIEVLAAKSNALALSAAMLLARGDDPERFSEIVAEIRMLAEMIRQTNQDTSSKASRLREVTGEAVDCVRDVAQRVQLVHQQTKAIAIAMQQQESTTREIAANMLSATDGAFNLSSNVDRLKMTIEEASGASTKVIEKASEMADEAHRLDSTVKSFLREVTA